MNTYCRLKSGKIFILWSDNVENETVDLIAFDQLDDLGNYDSEFIDLENYSYSEIDKIDRDLDSLQNLNQ